MLLTPSYKYESRLSAKAPIRVRRILDGAVHSAPGQLYPLPTADVTVLIVNVVTNQTPIGTAGRWWLL